MTVEWEERVQLMTERSNDIILETPRVSSVVVVVVVVYHVTIVAMDMGC